MADESPLPLSINASLPEDEVIYDKKNNSKLVVSYVDDEDGNIYKETKEYRIETICVSSSIAKRKTWKKYGDSKGDHPGPNPANTYPGENISIQYIQKKLADDSDRLEKELSKPKQAVTCRTCKGNHFTHHCPNKSDMEAISALERKMQESTTMDPEEKARLVPGGPLPVIPDGGSGRYIPPALRAGATPMPMPDRRRLEGFSIRVTNLPENTQEEDLREIFSPFGHVIRVFPAKDKKTQLNRGFAYISYMTQDEASQAIYTVDGMCYGHLILKVDWAQPSKT